MGDLWCVWYFFIISDSCDGDVESIIGLKVGLDPYDCETDYIVRAEWLLWSSGVSMEIIAISFWPMFYYDVDLIRHVLF